MATGCSGALDDVSSEKVDEVFINNTTGHGLNHLTLLIQ